MIKRTPFLECQPVQALLALRVGPPCSGLDLPTPSLEAQASGGRQSPAGLVLGGLTSPARRWGSTPLILRPLLATLLITALVLLAPGCTLFNNKRKDAATGNDKQKPPAADTGSIKGDDPLLGKDSRADTTALLAGCVRDQYGGKPGNVYIRWTCLDEPGNPSEAPIDATTDAQGYFIIQGLKANRRYLLVARARQGDRLIAGQVYVTAPDPKVVIKLSDKFNMEEIPPLPEPATFPGPKKYSDKSKSEKEKAASTTTPNWDPGIRPLVVPQPPPERGFGLDRPRPFSGAPAGGFPQNIVQEPSKDLPPTMQTPPNKPGGPSSPAAGPPSSGTPGVLPILVGDRVVNFSLPDISSGGTWEWKTNRKGHVVLLDFWYTTCLPCRDTIPHLKILQDRYGPRGLEIISIACETAGTLEEQKKRVTMVAQRSQTNYRLLLDPPGTPSVRNEFRIRLYPTLILLDPNGYIVWRHEGGLDRNDLALLERHIRTRLGLQ